SLFCRRRCLPRCPARLVFFSSLLLSLALHGLRAIRSNRFGFSVQPTLKNPALTHVDGGNANQLLFANAPALTDQPAGLTQLHSIDGIAHAAGIGKLGLAGPQLEVFDKCLSRLVIKTVVLLAQ